MKKHLLMFLFAAAGVAVNAQTPTSWIVQNKLGTWKGTQDRTVYMIAGGATGFCKDYDGNGMTLPEGATGVGFMKFVITDETNRKAAVYSYNGEKYIQPSTDGVRTYAEWGISNKDFKGTLSIPSQVKLKNTGDATDWYDVTEIQKYAFSYIPGIDSVAIQAKALTKIDRGAFIVDSKTSSYTGVNIKTLDTLTIAGDAFRTHLNRPGDTEKYEGDNYSTYFNDSRTCLGTVSIVSNGLTIEESAFSYCEGLYQVLINSRKNDGEEGTGGVINIGVKAFAVDRISPTVDDNGTPKVLPLYPHALPAVWERDDQADFIHIYGPVNTIGEYAFPGHVSVKDVTIKDPRSNNKSGGMTIGYCAFSNCFNGRDSKGKVHIEGPIEKIDNLAFGLFRQMVNNDTPIDEKKNFRPEGKRYESCLNDVYIKNTGTEPMTIVGAAGGGAFMGHFFHETQKNNKAAATIKIEGNIKEIQQRAFHCFEDNKVHTNGRRVKTIEINNKNLSDDPSATVAEMAIGHSAFRWISRSASAHEGTLTITGPLASIEEDAFRLNTRLETLTINSETNFRIGAYAFMDDPRLATLKYTTDNGAYDKTNWLPKKILSIGDEAFRNTGFTKMSIPKLHMVPVEYDTQKSYMKKATVDGKDYPNDTDGDVYNTCMSFGQRVFSECEKLEEVYIDNTATGVATFEITPRKEWEHIKFIQKATLGENVLFVQGGCFRGNQLTKLFIPKNVQVLGPQFVADNPDMRITFESGQPPYAMKYAFSEYASYDYDNNTWESGIALISPYIVVPKGCVSSYLFSTDDAGFQNSKDWISCEYKLSEGKNWGSLGMTPHTIKEYKAMFYDEEANSPVSCESIGMYIGARLASLDTKNTERGTFTDVYNPYRIGQTDEDSIVTFKGGYADVNVYTADYYYKSSGLVGLDKITGNAIVPLNTSTASRRSNIGYLFEGKEAGGTYYLHHYIGAYIAPPGEPLRMFDWKASDSQNGEHTYTVAGYGKLVQEAQESFDSEDIKMPEALNYKETDSWTQTTYSRSTAPNLLVAWDPDHTGYAQGDDFTIDDKWFGKKPCYYYGYDPASDTFRRLSATTWGRMKEGLAFLVVPKELVDTDGGGNVTLGKFIVGDDDNETTGITTINTYQQTIANGAYYTLDGRKLNARPTQRGIYIHNGRKEVIR